MLSHVGTLTNMFTPKAEQHVVSSDARTCAGRLKQTTCVKRVKINISSSNIPNKGFHTQRRADGRLAFSDGTE